MIDKSFIFLPGIFYKKEENLWKEGIKNWNDFLNKDKIKGISNKRKEEYDNLILEAKRRLKEEDVSYFNKVLPKSENWRFYDYFKENMLFLDIEVDSWKNIIVIGMFDGYDTKVMLKGYNLDTSILKNAMKNCKLLVTFNGSSFDLPLIEKQLGKLDIIHVDLKHLCNKLGLKGGLKEVEDKLKLRRPSYLKGSPVELWKTFHASGERRWLDTLIRYNEEDVVNLRFIMEHCYNKMKVLLLNSSITY